MNKKFKVLTDSTVDLTKEEIEKYGITILPLTALLNDTTYVDNETVTREEFIELMSNTDEFPKTTQPTLGTVLEKYNELTKDNTEVLAIHLTKELSGTFSTSLQATTMLEDNNNKAVSVDSKFAARALAFQVLKACECAEKGMTIEETLPILEEVKANTILYISLSNLDNLIKGGRISHLTGSITKLLNIKVNLKLIDGKLEIDSKGRGNKSILKRHLEIMNEVKNKEVVSIGITHTGMTETLETIIKIIKETFPNATFNIDYASLAVAAHVGKEGFAIQYLTK